MGITRKVGVLVSGRGANLRALVEAADADPALAWRVVGVVSNKPDAPALAFARARGLEAHVCADDATTDAALRAMGADFVACAGYMRILGADFVRRWRGRAVNIHPSLLPKYRGLHPHRRALAAGDTESGATVHWLTEEVDAGAIIAQARVPMLPGDDEATLAARTLEAELTLYPRALTLACGLAG